MSCKYGSMCAPMAPNAMNAMNAMNAIQYNIQQNTIQYNTCITQEYRVDAYLQYLFVTLTMPFRHIDRHVYYSAIKQYIEHTNTQRLCSLNVGALKTYFLQLYALRKLMQGMLCSIMLVCPCLRPSVFGLAFVSCMNDECRV